MSLPLCLLTIWYYRYALTLPIAEPDPTFSWLSELNTSLRTTTRNHDSEPPESIHPLNWLSAFSIANLSLILLSSLCQLIVNWLNSCFTSVILCGQMIFMFNSSCVLPTTISVSVVLKCATPVGSMTTTTRFFVCFDLQNQS